MAIQFEELVPPEGFGAPDVRLFITPVVSSRSQDYIDLIQNPLGTLINMGIPGVTTAWKVVLTLPNAEALFGGAGGPTMVATIEDTQTATITFLKLLPAV